jgi:hypothetical protein
MPNMYGRLEASNHRRARNGNRLSEVERAQPTTLPSREEQDALCDAIRFARIEARAAIARAGGVGLAAYLAALVASVTVSEASIKRYGTPNLLKGGRNRPAAGARTQSAISLLSLKVPAADAAATLDLDCDPGCKAIDAARDALIELLAAGEGSDADRAARSAIRDFDRAVGLAVAEVRHVVPVIVRAHRKEWGPSALHRDDAEAAALGGVWRACTCYRFGDASLVSYVRWHGWVRKAIREAEPTGRVVDSDFRFRQTDDENGTDAIQKLDPNFERYSAVAGVESDASEREQSAEDRLIDFEREFAARKLIAAGLAAVGDKDTEAARGLRGIVEGREVRGREWGCAVRLLRKLLGEAGIDRLSVNG